MTDDILVQSYKSPAFHQKKKNSCIAKCARKSKKTCAAVCVSHKMFGLVQLKITHLKHVGNEICNLTTKQVYKSNITQINK